MTGFLGTGATRAADLNLLAQVAMATVLAGGMILARAKRFRVHAWTQSTVLLLNLIAIGSVMLPSFRKQVASSIPSGLQDPYYAVATIHAGLGGVAEVLGLYVILVAGTNMVPSGLRFRNYKLWMRTTLGLWWAVVLLGVGVYSLWYVVPSPAATPQAAQPATVMVDLKNFDFTPKEVTVSVGTTVQWTDSGGRHQIVADDGSFKSDVMLSGATFQQKFDKAGTFLYYCQFHGGPKGQDMSGSVVVK